MPNKKMITAAIFASLVSPLAGFADPFNPRQVPAEAKWVLHADLDAARDSKTFDTLRDRVLANGDAQAKFDQIEQLTGVKIPDDLNDVTIYGKEAGDEAGVVVVHGKIDQTRVTKTLQMADQFARNPYGSYDVLTWLDKDKNQTMYGAFHDPSHVIIGRNEKNIDTALDAMDGKVETLKADSPLAAGATPQLMVYISARDLPDLHQSGAKPNPVLDSVQSAWIALSEKDDMVTLHAALQGASADTATDLATSLNGFKGMLSLTARGDNPDPVARAVVAASKTFTTTQKDNTVLIDWPVPVEQVQQIMTAMMDKHGQKN